VAPSSQQQEALRPPQSLTPAEREQWAKWNPEAQKAFHRRELQVSESLRTATENKQFREQFSHALGPVERSWAARGIHPMQAVASMAQFEMRLATGSPQQRAQAFWELASAYGVTEDALVETRPNVAEGARQPQALPPEVMEALQFNRNLMQMLQQTQQQRQQTAEQQFAASHEFYSDVKPEMDALKRANPNLSDEQAYKIACRANDEISAILDGREAQKRAAEEKAKVQRHLAAGSSLPNKPSSSGGAAGKGSAFHDDINRILDGG
jgi:hypothetical protein